MLVACLVAPASAGLEYSIYQWWTDQAKTSDGTTPVHPDWGADYAAWTTADIWGQYVDLETWTIPTPAVPGYAKIKYEYAGNASTNTFGWYETVGGAKHEIMSGPDDYLTAEKTITFVPPAAAGDTFGFYLGADGKTLYTEKALNAAVSGTQQRWVKIFKDPRAGHASEWILCWEDKNKPLEDPFTAGSLATASPVEADFNDMIVTFKWQPTPELSTILLLGLSLVAVPVVCRKRRS
jgi:hypothetical protein